MRPDIQKLADNIPVLLQWYRQNARDLPWRQSPTPYHVWVSEVMLQQTRVEAVVSYYRRFLEALPDIPALAEASDDRLHKLWEGLGYYSRARNLKKAAQIIVREHGGKLPDRYEQLLKLPGIGSYTAGAVASIAFGLPAPAVDGNVLRVLSRFLGKYDDIAQPKTKSAMERLLASVIPADAPGDFTQALMELGAVTCLPGGAPKCGECPWRAVCTANREALQSALPVKKAKPKRKIEKKTVLVVIHNGRLALQKRGDTGLLAGMWALPALDGRHSGPDVRAFLGGAGCAVRSISSLPPHKHIFTHIEWRMSGYLAHVETPGDFIWASPAEVQSRYAIPSAFRAFVRAYLAGQPAPGP